MRKMMREQLYESNLGMTAERKGEEKERKKRKILGGFLSGFTGQ